MPSSVDDVCAREQLSSMWINPLFAADRARGFEFVARSPLATIVAADPLRAAHLPVLLDVRDPDRPVLVGHVPRIDPISKQLTDGSQILTIFTGPSSYISPAWFDTAGQLPTYNFVAVHATGTAQAMGSDAELIAHLTDLMSFHEDTQTHGQQPKWAPDDYATQRMRQLLPRIVGFTITIDTLEAKAKLGQDSTQADQLAVAHALESSPDSHDHAVAGLMTGLLDH